MSNPHPNLENLKPFVPGFDERRGHIKKGATHSSTRLRRLLELTENLQNPITQTIEGFTVLEQLDLAQIIKARKGDTKAYESILDRLEGKPQQKLTVYPGDVNELLDTIEQSDYGQLGQEAEKQMVANDASVQNKEQERTTGNVQAELPPATAPIPAGITPVQPSTES